MKKILIALAMTGFVLSAEAQTEKISCGANSGKVCRKSSGKNISCYKTKYAENFKVCKGNSGYFICCEERNRTNSTSATVQARAKQYVADDYQDMSMPSAGEFVAPVSQSAPQYGTNYSSSYEGYYGAPATKGKMKACYVGDNVAELTRAPWQGCNSPENDGADKNRQRNVNVVYAAGE